MLNTEGKDALSDRINILHNLVNYGYADQESAANPSSSDTSLHIGVKRVNTQVLFNLPDPVNGTLYVRLSGSIRRSNSGSSVRNWPNGINLIPGHRYRASLVFISGTVQGTTAPYVAMSVYKLGTSSSMGDSA